MTLSQHPAIFWHFCGNFRSVRGPLQNYHAKAGTKNEPWHVFGAISKKGLENRSSHFEPKNSWLSFSRGSGPPLKCDYRGLLCSIPCLCVFLRMWSLLQYNIAFEPGYLRVSPVLRPHLCSIRLFQKKIVHSRSYVNSSDWRSSFYLLLRDMFIQ